MSQVEPERDLELLLRSRHGVILLDTAEEDRAAALVARVSERLGLPVFGWSATKGLRLSGNDGAIYGTADPLAALAHIEASDAEALYQLDGFGPHLARDMVVRALLDAAGSLASGAGAVVLTGEGLEVPAALRPLAATVRLPPPGREELRALLGHVLRDVSARGPAEVALTRAEMDRLLSNLQGLTLLEAEKVLTRAIVEDGRLTPEDIGAALEAKRAIIEREGLLEYYPVEESMAEVADLAGLKDWLGKRRELLAHPERAAEYGLSFPKGILLLGVPGCGKSLCAKATAVEWTLPLLKLDTSNLYSKYIGESERNFKRAMATAERMAPVILWIDEVEKAFAPGGENDGGVSQRVLGNFLSWMQERRGDVFIVATANDVARLPPEFLRKGRFDEIFFVDLPDADTRRAIFEIHLRRRGREPSSFELDSLVGAAEGFSGAEIEQVVVSALYTAFAARAELTTEGVLDEVAATRPLSRAMPERIESLRSWARDRTVRAN